MIIESFVLKKKPETKHGGCAVCVHAPPADGAEHNGTRPHSKQLVECHGFHLRLNRSLVHVSGEAVASVKLRITSSFYGLL